MEWTSENKWKTVTKYVDIETGEEIHESNKHNYTIKSHDTTHTVQNGNGRKEITYQCQRIYGNDLFGNKQ